MKHGLYYTRLYSSWRLMVRRCFNPSDNKYHAYGAVGIKPCESLRASAVNLLALIGERPKDCTLDRIDGLLGYYCGDCAECVVKGWRKNVRWATATEQNRNKRTAHFITIEGTTKPMWQWATEYGLSYNGFQERVRRGWKGRELLVPVSTLFHKRKET